MLKTMKGSEKDGDRSGWKVWPSGLEAFAEELRKIWPKVDNWDTKYAKKVIRVG